MLMKSDTARVHRPLERNVFFSLTIAMIAVGIALLAFRNPLLELVHRWTVQEEYSHGFFIPLISAWLLWSRRVAVAASIDKPSWAGPGLILIAAAMHIVGELSALFLLSQVGFIVALFGIA